MVTRGIWNLHFGGRWYRFRLCDSKSRVSPPDHPQIRQKVRDLRALPDKLDEWEPIPFRSPMHWKLNYIYAVDQDAGYPVISFWKIHKGSQIPVSIQLSLDTLYDSNAIDTMGYISDVEKGPLPRPGELETPSSTKKSNTNDLNIKSRITGALNINFGPPSPTNDLQAQFFTDFVFIWRSYIDDPLAWKTTCPVFKVIMIAILRLAACDFEVSDVDDVTSELPISFSSIPSWTYPKSDTFWFHGYLVILQEDIVSNTAIMQAMVKTKLHTEGSQLEPTRLILLSPQSVAFAEYSRDSFLVSGALTLLSNLSATQCPPGFHNLARVFTSGCWRSFTSNGERTLLSESDVPIEIFHMIFQELEPRDMISFAQASFAAEICYYTSMGQFKHTTVEKFEYLIPCCGQRIGLVESGVCCSNCYLWQHMECIGLEKFVDNFVCTPCLESTSPGPLEPGGIQSFNRGKARGGCQVTFMGSPKLLQLRVTKPAHLRGELRLIGNLWKVAPAQVDYSILFNGTFSGLAYGMEEKRKSDPSNLY
ncbi:hypothetical protein N7466_011514 [Penicillium verhagenii]|uniref:uncharacterized protein n=1 Tax=Penicillium verhagenii TaxID=1562060 RepID=UPI00254541F9|nr:uncharacterized protein N7466_011514 [Penicillium verhagenii]KAJ5915581.1 hypothetical protein N7466_011514 [Penicillium verhagenii]